MYMYASLGETGQGDENGVKTVLHNVLNESLTKRGVDIKVCTHYRAHIVIVYVIMNRQMV